jgi:toxin ParE1/3/4
MKVRWTTLALHDLEAIGDYIARDNAAAAERLVSRIFAQVDVLASHGHIGRPGRVPGTRELVISDTSYIAPYRVIADAVEILAVFHGARQWPERFH